MMEIRLGDFVKIKTGKLNANAKDENGEYPFFTCAREISRINKFAYDCECVLVAGNGELNAKYYKGKFNAYQRVYIIEVKDKELISTRFLFYFIDKYMEKLRNGSIGGIIKYIKLNHLTDITLNLPDLPTQNKIVALLDKASALVQKRENSIAQLDELLRAQFLEMFGDPVLNPKGWESKTIENLCNVQGGLTISQHKRKDYPYEIPYLRVANVFRGNIDLSEIKKIKVTEKEIERVQLKTNDILVVEGHGNIEEIGRVAIWLKSELKMLHQNHLIRLRVKVDFLKVNYFVQYLNSDGGKYKMKAISNSTSGLNTISTGKVKSIEIPIPPIELQNQFETIYHNIHVQKETLIQSKLELENLYHSLLQRAFSGQLI